MQAATAAVRQHAPGLLARAGQQFGQGAQGAQQGGPGRGFGGMAGAMHGNSGRWVRQGRKIVLYGA